MKKFALISLVACAAACSSSSTGTSTTGSASGATSGTTGTSSGSGSGSSGTTTGSGSGSSGSITITFDVAVHPAAVAALAEVGLQPPNLYAGGPGDAGYVLLIQGLQIAGSSVVFNDFQKFSITDGGVYSVTLTNAELNTKATVGVLAGIDAALPDGGYFSGVFGPSDGGLPQLSCSAVNGTGGLSAALTAAASTGLTDYYFPSGSQVGGEAYAPSASVANSGAYLVPMSYASLLNCAGNPSKTTNDSDLGVALVYVTDGGGPAAGSPISGATVSLNGAINVPALTATYFANNYTETSATGTDDTGVATFVNIEFHAPPTVTTFDTGGDTFFSPGIGSSSNSFFNCFVYEQ